MFSNVMRSASKGIRLASERTRIRSAVLQIKIDTIESNPVQPRKRFDEGELMSLASSVRQNGILQPLSVRRDEQGRTLLIAGERRLRAARLAGLTHVPCILLQVDEQQAAVLALMENLQREDLTCFEEAEGIQRLIEEGGLTREEVALRLGKAQSTLANKLRLLQLHPWQRKRIEAAGLCERHARALLRLDPSRREEALNMMIANQMTVGEAEAMVAKMLEPPPAVQKRSPIFRDLRLFVNTINHAVDTMRRSGVNARADKQESERFIEYHIVIPKPVECEPSKVRQAGAAAKSDDQTECAEEALDAAMESMQSESEPADWGNFNQFENPSQPVDGLCFEGWDATESESVSAQENKATPDHPILPDKPSLEALLRRVVGGRTTEARGQKPRVSADSTDTQSDGEQTMLDGFVTYTQQG